MTLQTIGQILAGLAFSGALVSAYSYFQAEITTGERKKSWEWMGKGWFGAHSIGVLGIMSLLFFLIYFHQYQFYYVWNHSSNELPVYYMISCFWEGQEGSFLLWAVWHVVLGWVIQKWGGDWRNGVMGTLSAVNMILTTMILGVRVPVLGATLMVALALAVPMIFLFFQTIKRPELSLLGGIRAGGTLLGLLGLVLVFFGFSGLIKEGVDDENVALTSFVYFVLVVYGVFFVGNLVFSYAKKKEENLGARDLLAGFSALIFLYLVAKYPIGEWHIGSSPFVLHKEVMGYIPVYSLNPDYVPVNGQGLNPLLQNYWMVIHPPTLFLGFAATTVPFGYVLTALLRRNFAGWVNPATPWMVFSALTLGVGIIMGGYWAYETLNFGGYWNWDPVENSSLVPWLLAVAAIHTVLAWRKSGAFLNYAMIMVLLVFILVLYSTFLTRSGILGESSVHSFTDLGLSGQLLVLLFVFLFVVGALYLSRIHSIPSKSEVSTQSVEFYIFLGTIVLLFGGIVITVFTSIPVFNAILGTAWSPPKDTAFLYYRWTVYLAVGFGVLSALSQFLFWNKVAGKSVKKALARPFVLAMVSATLIVIALALGSEKFAFESRYEEWRQMAESSSSGLQMVVRYFRLFFFAIADEILLFASLFAVFANLDILIALLRKKIGTLKVSGGSLSHLGFGLMLVGIFFSAGYDRVISKNVNPQELANFSEQEQIDNVVLFRDVPRDIVGYQVTYLGKKEATPPVSHLEILEEDGEAFKISFLDSTGDEYAYTMPREVFISNNGKVDLKLVEDFLNDKVEFLRPKMINERTLYRLRFIPRYLDGNGEAYLDSSGTFFLSPEAEVNPGMGLIAHPARRIQAHRDIYVHVSGLFEEPDPASIEFTDYPFALSKGDTVQTARAQLILEQITADTTNGVKYDLVARAHVRVTTDMGRQYVATPVYRIDKEGRVTYKEFYASDISSYISFLGVNMATGKIQIHVQEEKNAKPDSIVLKALSKPWINFLWLGTFVLTAGFCLSIYRRVSENRARKQSRPAPNQDE